MLMKYMDVPYIPYIFPSWVDRLLQDQPTPCLKRRGFGCKGSRGEMLGSLCLFMYQYIFSYTSI